MGFNPIPDHCGTMKLGNFFLCLQAKRAGTQFILGKVWREQREQTDACGNIPYVFLFPKRTDIIVNTLHKERHPTTRDKFSSKNEISYGSGCGSRKQWQYTTTCHDHVVHHLRDEVNCVVHKYDIVTAIHKVHHSFCRMAVQKNP